MCGRSINLQRRNQKRNQRINQQKLNANSSEYPNVSRLRNVNPSVINQHIFLYNRKIESLKQNLNNSADQKINKKIKDLKKLRFF